MPKKKRVLNVFLLAMMNVAIILSLRGLPLMAREGISMIFYLLFALLIFLLPTSLVSAELATGWPEEGGVFRWVSEAFGERAGFTAIWLQWVQNIFWYPAVLSFAAGAIAYLVGQPELANSAIFSIAVILVIYWGSTAINLRGIKAAGWLSTAGVLLGTILPVLIIIVLGLIWWGSGKPVQPDLIKGRWLPNFDNFSHITFLAGIILLFSGMEVNAVHATEVKNPRVSYPRAILLSVVIIFSCFFLGSISVAAVLPASEISLTAGVMEAFEKLLHVNGLDVFVPFLGLLAAFGAIGGVAAWIVGPSKGMYATSKKGLIPPLLSSVNKHDVPQHILLIQGCVVTILSFLFLVTPTVSNAFFLLTALGVMLYLAMYILLFAAALRLRYKEPNRPRPYQVHGGLFGMWFVAGVGILGALFAIFVGFFPPALLPIASPTFYVTFLAVGLFLGLAIPQVIYSARKPSWKRRMKNAK